MNAKNRHNERDAPTPAHGGRSIRRDDRGISTPVTHSLSIGITTVLIFGLVFAANGYLEDQQNAGARQQVETIGTELASQLEDAARLGDDSQQATLRVDQPATVMSNTYSVSLEPPGECPMVSSANTCLEVDVTRGGENLVRGFPVHNDTDVSVSVARLDSTTFTLAATRTGGTSTRSSVIPMDQTLTIGIGKGVSARSTGQVLNPFNRPPIPKFTFEPSFPDSSDDITFNASNSRDPDGTIQAYHWIVEGVNYSSQGETYTTSLARGDNDVTLKVVDDEDGVATRTRNISVSGLEYNEDIGTISSCNPGKCVEFTMNNTWSETITVSHLLITPKSSFDRIHYKEGSVDGIGSWGTDSPDPELRIDTNGDGSWDATEEFNGHDPLELSDKDDGAIVAIDPVDIPSGSIISVQIRGFRGGGNPIDSTIGLRYWVDDESRRTIFGS